MNRSMLWVFALLGIFAWAGCGTDEEPKEAVEQGSLSISIYGEEFIEDRIPAWVFDDGWEVHFQKFLLHLGRVSALHETSSEVSFGADQGWTFDLTASTDGAGQVVHQAPTAVGRYPRVDYEITPALSTSSGGNATSDDRALMLDNGYSVYVVAEAKHATQPAKHFSWGFSTTTRYSECESLAEVTKVGTGSTQLTIHADHLFLDDLVSPEAGFLFDLIAAADADNDGDVTMAELEVQSIIGQERYGVGNHTEVENLAQFIGHLVGTVGHIDGEGHCHNN
ncbi:MAG: hypothetical protein JRH20_27225 [Deltaproteobacteria bacterium]|nr:hypothetical protein [Deltaproteobacteria bacterium]